MMETVEIESSRIIDKNHSTETDQNVRKTDRLNPAQMITFPQLNRRISSIKALQRIRASHTTLAYESSLTGPSSLI